MTVQLQIVNPMVNAKIRHSVVLNLVLYVSKINVMIWNKFFCLFACFAFGSEKATEEREKKKLFTIHISVTSSSSLRALVGHHERQKCMGNSVFQIRRGDRDNLGIISHISP